MRSYWNPFSGYIVATIFVVLVYSLGFSSTYPALQMDVVLFLLFSTGSAATFYLLVVKQPLTQAAEASKPPSVWLPAMALIASYVAEFVYSGGIPLINMISGAGGDYQEFGIPTFHVVLTGFDVLFCVYWWDSYLVTRRVKYLLASMIGVLAGILSVSRGGVLMLLLSYAFAFGNRRGLLRYAPVLGVAMVGIILGFGYLGAVRMGDATQDFILSIGGANEKFIDSGLPDSVFWFYLYASSPLANLQLTASNHPSDSIQLIGIAADFLPDFVSKHLVTPEQFEEIASMRINYGLTVGTAYARPIITLGWAGAYALHLTFLLFSYVAIRLSRRSSYYAPLLAIFCTLGLLMFFDNMLVFAGMIVPVLIGLVLVAWERVPLARRPGTQKLEAPAEYRDLPEPGDEVRHNRAGTY